MQAAKTIVMGIDPGYDRLGWAVGSTASRKLQLIDHGSIQTDKNDSILVRYQVILSQLGQLIAKYQPDQVAIEELYFSTNKKTALRVSEVRGVILALFLQNNIAVFEYHPQSIKLAVTGHGKADKSAMAKQLQLELGVDPKLIDDELDAIAISLTHVLTHGVS